MGSVNEASRPVAVRVIRPYSSEDEYVAKEGDSITKTTIELIGAHSRPAGVILRFEVTLQSGKTLIRGEGRVTQFNERGRDGQPSLSLRFTKLDAKSKALVDRTVALRTPGAVVPPPAPSSQDIHPLAPPSAPSVSASASTPQPTPVQAAPPASTRPQDTAPPPTPIMSRDEAVAHLRAAVEDDPDPEGDAVTNPPPEVAAALAHAAPGTTPPGSSPPAFMAGSPGTVPPPTTRPSVLPPAVRAELRRLSEMPPPLPSALPAYDAAPDEAAKSDEDEKSEPIITSAPVVAAAPAIPVTTPHAGTSHTTNHGTNGNGKRDALLARLRERARALPPDRVAEITKPRGVA